MFEAIRQSVDVEKRNQLKKHCWTFRRGRFLQIAKNNEEPLKPRAVLLERIQEEDEETEDPEEKVSKDSEVVIYRKYLTKKSLNNNPGV